ncbi:MAG: hypothetical protein NTX33_04640 [Propionibacteriales bacterium]|nr:hypothetical protein [Propionibacteriales bacterium]
MGVITSLHRRDRSLVQQWWGRTTAAVTVIALVAVVLATTGIVRQGEPDVTAPVAGPAGPATSAPAAETRIPAVVAPAPAPAVVEPVAVVRRAPLAGRYPGALLDAPDGTLGAYQRAAAIINATADCHLDWMTLAAIARIESNHGRGPTGSHDLNDDGVVTPAFVGKPLNGRAGRGEVDDTDAGKVDGNKRWDAPVGPFGLLPATWATVAVDADGDDVRDPQDVDDASLAAAVVLCAGGKDMADAKALRKALTAYHRTRGFAATVVQLTALYAEEMDAVPVFMAAPGLLPIPDDLAEICDCARESKKGGKLHASADSGPSSGGAPPPADPGGPGPGDSGGPGAGGDPVDPPADPPADPVEPVEPEPDPVEPPPATEADPEPEPEPAPVDPPSEPEPDPATAG